MKTKILSRMLLSVAIVAISVMMTAGSCKKADVLSIAKALKVTSTVSTEVAVETDAKTGVSTVSIVHVSDKGLPKTNTGEATALTMDVAGVVDGFLKTKAFAHSKEVFTVEIPLATSGIVLSKMRSGDKSEKLEDVATSRILFDTDIKDAKFKPQDGFAFMPAYEGLTEAPAYSKTLQFMSGLINKESYFAPNHKAADAAVENTTGLLCRAGAAKIESADVTNAALVAAATLSGEKPEGIKEDTFKDKTFEGAQKASCYTVRNVKAEVAEWQATAPTDSVRERALLFLGIETGKATIGDIAKAVPKVFSDKEDTATADGFNKTSLEALAKQYPITQVANVVVKMIGKAGSGEKDDE